MGYFKLDPAQQGVGFGRNDRAGQVALTAEYRQQVARGVGAGRAEQLRGAANRRRADHGRPGVGQCRAIGVEKRHGAHVILLQGLGGDATEQHFILAPQCIGGQRRQILSDHFAALQQLALQFAQLHPGEIATEHRRHQAGRQNSQ